ncbi:hypothetical protein MNBD_GAMMA22-2257 [hydrothermal vent metagenome]|uniref:Calx-beta domain-containing protein n=1 Tax=hydrothermal vent metagenome TaxID=652676 RepID=A0A3B1ABK1_9ZZZZ
MNIQECLLLLKRKQAVILLSLLVLFFITISSLLAPTTASASPKYTGNIKVSFATLESSVQENAGFVYVDVILSSASTDTISVEYETHDGTALAGSDYVDSSGKLIFAPGVTSQRIAVSITDDLILEGNEYFTLNLEHAYGALVDEYELHTITIIDDDNQLPGPPGTISFNATTFSVLESLAIGSVTLTVNRSGGSNGIVTVDYSTLDITALGGSDYTTSSGTLVFADGEVIKTITINIIDDLLLEGNEDFSVNLTNATGGASIGINASNTVTIIDNEIPIPGTLSFLTPTSSVAENVLSGAMTLEVVRTGGSNGIVTVDFATSDGTAVAVNDYITTSGTLTFADGVLSQTLSIVIVDDVIVESSEDFRVSLSNATGGAGIGTGTNTITIVDDDVFVPTSTLSFTVVSSSVDEAVVGGTVIVVVDRTGDTTTSVTVDYATSDGTALAGSDYTASIGTLTFAAGITSQNIAIPIIDDLITESTEDFTVILSNPTGGADIGNSTHTVSILDDDVFVIQPSVSFSVTSSSVIENVTSGTVTVVVDLVGSSTSIVTVDYATTDGSALAGSDYTANTGTLTFDVGVITQNIVIPIINDNIIETLEDFSITLNNPSVGTVLGVNTTHTVSIVDDD